MNNHQLILATDLDGTFLAGDPVIKQKIYTELMALKNQMLLIYVTGRGIDAVQELCLAGYLPPADFILGDHGTRIVDGEFFRPVVELQNPIIKQWNNANERIKNLLQDEPGLELQPFIMPYRVAYYYDPSVLLPTTIAKIITAGFDSIFSCGMYLDILPKGINKGTSLLQLIDYLGTTSDSVIVCGDSLNDLCLFQTGLNGIMVGNAEPGLIAAVKNLQNVFRCALPGIHGIMEGLRFYKKHNLFSEELLNAALLTSRNHIFNDA